MQANDMLAPYDDRDDFEIRQARMAARAWRNEQYCLDVIDNTEQPITMTSGKLATVIDRYNYWWKLCKGSSMTDPQGTDLLTFRIRRGDGLIVRHFTARMA